MGCGGTGVQTACVGADIPRRPRAYLTLGGRFGLGDCCCAGGTVETSSHAVGLAQVGISPTRNRLLPVFTCVVYIRCVCSCDAFLSWCAFALSVGILHSQFLRVRGPAWVWRCGDPPRGGRERPPSAHASCSRRGGGVSIEGRFLFFPPTAVHETVEFKMCSRILHVG